MGDLDIRQSQLVMSTGVGSIIDFPKDSLMLAGLDYWPYVTYHRREELKNHYRIIDIRLQRWLSRKLNRTIEAFFKPIEAPPTGMGNREDAHLYHRMPFIRFPTWYWCPGCHLLHQLTTNTPMGDEALFCQGVHARGKRLPCGEFKGRGRRKGKVRLLPSRFVIACEAGHIDDFPYLTFIRHKQPCDAKTGDIFMNATGGMGLSGIKLSCANCGASRLMSNALSGDHLAEALANRGCPARRPWLPNAEYAPPCPHPPRLVQKGSVNLYAAKYESAIYVPDKTRQIEQKLTAPDLEELLVETYDPDSGSVDELRLKLLVIWTEIPREDILHYLKQNRTAKPTVQSPEDFLNEEYTAFLKPLSIENKHDFDPLDINIGDYPNKFAHYFDRVVLLRKLRETRVFTGFSRLGQDSAAPPISQRTFKWLPGIEVRGEGIFLQLRAERLQEWETGLDSPDYRRLQNLQSPSVRRVHRYVMIHTLAHLLIRQLSFDCGYSSTALRERLYVGGNGSRSMHGVLIYTASGDSEGTMGGLVRQGRPGNLERSWETAINLAEVCSNDPLCMESKGQGYQNRNLAACHACTLIPETACEVGNQFLDRRLVIGDPIHGKTGFFDRFGTY